MGDVSENFDREELACNCGCGFAAADVELLEVLEVVRSYFDAPVIVTSGCRCENYNAEVGGAVNSMHVKGMAADFQVKGFHAHAVAEWLRTIYPDKYGIGEYPTWVHLDVRPGPARRWYKT